MRLPTGLSFLAARRLEAPLVTALLCTALALLLAVPAQAQDDWRAYPAFNEVTAVASGLGRLWAGTPAGIFAYDPASGEIERTTTIDGLHGGPLRALAVDATRGVVWAGYGDGTLDRIAVEDGSIRTFLDIARNGQYASRGVRRLIVRGDSLYAATDFGVVVFDAAREEVRNTYARLAGLPSATPVNDVLFAPLPAESGGEAPGIWLATEAGIVTAPAASSALQSPTAWTLDPGFPGRALSLARFDGGSGPEVYAGGGPAAALGLYRRAAGGVWTREIQDSFDFTDLVVDGDRILVRSQYTIRAFAPGAATTIYTSPAFQALSGIVLGPDGARWAGDAGIGLFPLPDHPDDGTNVPVDPQPVLPEGPFSNEINDIDVGRDGTLWAVTAFAGAAQSAAINRLDATTETWTALLSRDRPDEIGRAGLASVIVGPDDATYVGTGGDGLVVVAPDGAIARYDETNSSLRTADPNSPSFVNVSDVAFERDNRWVTNREAPVPLHLFDASGTWTGLPFPAGTSGGQGRYALAIDRLGQKWLAVGSGGLIVWDTGDDPASPSDDRGRQFRGQGSGQTGLPDPDVRDVVVDGDGTVWIGTARGLATVFNPGSAFATDPGLATPQLTLTPPDATGQREFFLRDVLVNDLDVDPSGRVWVATTTGAFLIAPSPDGSGYVIARTLDAATTPLPTDVITRIAVRPSDGRVFLATDNGLFSVDGDATRPNVASEALRASPSPFRPGQSPGGVVVSGLVSARSTVRVLTLAGERIHQADVAGGSFRWDGRDDRTGQLVSSGVYIVTAVDEDGKSVVGKVAVIR